MKMPFEKEICYLQKGNEINARFSVLPYYTHEHAMMKY